MQPKHDTLWPIRFTFLSSRLFDKQYQAFTMDSALSAYSFGVVVLLVILPYIIAITYLVPTS
jgi:hypothetical protein